MKAATDSMQTFSCAVGEKTYRCVIHAGVLEKSALPCVYLTVYDGASLKLGSLHFRPTLATLSKHPWSRVLLEVERQFRPDLWIPQLLNCEEPAESLDAGIIMIQPE